MMTEKDEFLNNRRDTSENSEPEIDFTGRMVINPVVSCRIEGEDSALLFNPDTDDTLIINPVGLSIWTFLDQPRTISDIVSYLTSAFSNTPNSSVVRQEVEVFIRELGPDFISNVDTNATKSDSD